MADVQVKDVSRSFGAHKALDGVSIDFPDGGFYALLGPSGSGKTTLLRMIAGFDFPDSGKIFIGGEGVERVPVEKRHIGMVFQSYALFPNMSVADNVAFGLSVRGQAKNDIATAVQGALDLVQLCLVSRARQGSRRRLIEPSLGEEIAGADDLGVRKGSGPLDPVAQLAHVPRPRMGKHGGPG